jgi:hypothetical protein
VLLPHLKQARERVAEAIADEVGAGLGTPLLAASIQSHGEKAAGAGSVDKRPAVLDFDRQPCVTNPVVAEQLALEGNTHDGLPHACLTRAPPLRTHER